MSEMKVNEHRTAPINVDSDDSGSEEEMPGFSQIMDLYTNCKTGKGTESKGLVSGLSSICDTNIEIL